MPYFRILLLSSAIIAQSAQPPESKDGLPSTSASPAKSAGIKSLEKSATDKSSVEQPGVPKEGDAKAAIPAAPVDEPETEADKFVKATADKMDAISFVSADLRQIIRYLDRNITANGSYAKGPGYRTSFELTIDYGEGSGRRINVANDQAAFSYEKILNVEQLQKFDLAQIMPLVENKDIPPQILQQLYGGLPFVKPGEMLRGYVGLVSFEKMTKDTFGGRDVTVVEGHWRKSAVQRLSGNPEATIEAMGASMPQYLRLFLDQETGWPLRIEMYRRDKEAEYKPIYILEFLKLSVGKPIEEARFQFNSPTKDLVPDDLTEMLVKQLRNFPDKKTKKATTGSAVSGKIGASTKKSEAPAGTDDGAKKAPGDDAKKPAGDAKTPAPPKQ